MLFYLIMISVSVLIIVTAGLGISQANTLFDVLDMLLRVLGGVASVIALDGVVAILIRRLLPTSWFSADRECFFVGKRERDLYRRLGIKRWKELVPELGGFTGFHKNKLQSVSDLRYLERFLVESNYGVVIHLANAVLGFLIFFLPFCSAASIWVPIFAVNFFLSLMPVAVLRYTCYTLQRLYKRSANRK